MDTKLLENAGINYEEGLHRFGNNERLYLRFLNDFPNDLNYKSAKDIIDSKDYKQILFYVHALKGISGNLSIIPLYESCSALVVELRRETIDEEIVQSLFKEVTENYEKALAVLPQ